ncbi:RICIN domain-containing protein [Streptomyces sp. HNM0663]|uniref:RICIN domain-containing protein n=1 Tax=Streptomyces chengmaiensis TaxID=3040919 RepID=A0ABT6HZI1_9ACTN|nr:RICIN domain-containing protein [Streptomyces chengmaiensis]MDH2394124.1 RICIN domain-containing protein [Streptomyces chengmaiensis]
MHAPRSRLAGALATAALVFTGVSTLATPTASADSTAASYTVTVGAKGSWTRPDDTPASPYIDKDGTFYYQQAHALYGTNNPRKWTFYTGTDFDSANRSGAISDAVNPANSADRNNDTTWRCNNSPTGVEATPAPAGSGYAHRNYCDLTGMWVDPDTGDWYGLVHNEFTPQPFADGIHYDGIDYAVSTDQGRTWTIKDHVITSPYSTKRGDTTAFPQQTYHYGTGDPRLFADTASGYFYAFYGSRIVNKGGGWAAFYGHVARSPISAKMAPDSWRKWYNGAWTEPGVGGRESNMVPVGSGSITGYTPPSKEYNPANSGTVSEQVAAGLTPPTSPLFVMDITYNAHLGLYIGQPQAVDQSGNASQEIYATDNLTTQKWFRLGDTGSYKNASWYRWFLDSANKTSSGIVGKDFRSYCSFGCSNNTSAEYINLKIDTTAPAAPVDTAKTYRIANGNGRVLAQASGSSATTSLTSTSGSGLEAWTFASNGDGSYRIANASTGQLLGVGATATSTRAWGTKPTVTNPGSAGPTVGQQWFVIPGASPSDDSPTGTYKIVNRYSGLVIGLSANSSRLAETTPTRTWTNSTGNAVGGARTAGEQTLTLTPTGEAPETVSVNHPGNQSGTVNKAVSLQLDASNSANKPLTFSATGLPAGLSISSSGLVTGTPTTAGSSNVTVTATSGSASGTVTFTWSVSPLLNGVRTLTSAGKALDNPGSSTTAGTQLITWSPNGGANQNWTFTQQTDGTYVLKNNQSGLCVDVNSASTSADAKIIQWTCTGAANQRWTLTLQANGTYTVASAASGLLLTTASSTDGALVTQQPDTGTSLQRWTIN